MCLGELKRVRLFVSAYMRVLVLVLACVQHLALLSHLEIDHNRISYLPTVRRRGRWR